MATPTEMAHEAQLQIAKLRTEFDARFTALDKLNLLELRERIAVLEEKYVKLERELETVKSLPMIADRADRLGVRHLRVGAVKLVQPDRLDA